MCFTERVLHVHGGLPHVARPQCTVAKHRAAGVRGVPVSPVLLPHVRLRDGPAEPVPAAGGGQPPPPRSPALEAPRGAEHLLDAGHGGLHLRGSPPGEPH